MISRQRKLTKPVPGHEDEGVDGDVCSDVYDVLDCPAPGQPEGPEHQDVVTGRGRDTNLPDVVSVLSISLLVTLLVCQSLTKSILNMSYCLHGVSMG